MRPNFGRNRMSLMSLEGRISSNEKFDFLEQMRFSLLFVEYKILLQGTLIS